MPYKCCAPKCKTNYDSETGQKSNIDGGNEIQAKTTQETKVANKKGKNVSQKPELHLFKFPDATKYPERRSEWISKVPRAEWKPDSSSELFLCELHFREEDIIRYSTDTNSRRKRKKTAEGDSSEPQKLERP